MKNHISFRILLYIIIFSIISIQLLQFVIYNIEYQNIKQTVDTEQNLVLDKQNLLVNNYYQAVQTEKQLIQSANKNKLNSIVYIQYNYIQKQYNEYQEYIKQHPKANKSKIEQQYKNKALEFISKIRYDNGNYVWVNDIKGIMLEHPEKKLVGKNLLGLQDIKGQYIFQSMINICKQKGEGYVYYYWQYPNSTKIYQKESFVKEFKPWGLIVGSGLYLKDEQILLKQSEQNLYNKLKQQITTIKLFNTGYIIIGEKKNDNLYFKIYIKPELDGKLFPSEDKKGNPLGSKIRGLSGHFEYYWTDLNSNKIVKKTLYYIYNPTLKWYIIVQYYNNEQFGVQNYLRNLLIYIFLGYLIILSLILYVVIRKLLHKRIKDLPQILSDFQSGDMTISIKEDKVLDEIGIMIQQIDKQIIGVRNTVLAIIKRNNQLTDSISNLDSAFSNVSNVSDTISDKTQTIIARINDLSQNIEEVNASQEEFGASLQTSTNETLKVNQSMENISKSVAEITNMNNLIKEKLNNLLDEKQEASLKNTVGLVQENNKKIQKIRDFQKVIVDIADKTNLLSLNQSIEQAKQGSEGKGFAVIADEIRQLATDSKENQTIISKEIDEIIDMSNRSDSQIQEMEQQVIDINSHTIQLIKSVDVITQDLLKQKEDMNSLSNNIEGLNAISEELSSAINNIAEIFDALNTQQNDIADKLPEQVNQLETLQKQNDTLKDINKGLNTLISYFKVKEE